MSEPSESPVDAGGRNTLRSARRKVRIVLTYDDGPFWGSKGSTQEVLDFLQAHEAETGEIIKVAFFIQTHVDRHLVEPEGRRLVELAHEQGHLIAIHGGSEPDPPSGISDHHWHPSRALDASPDPAYENGLEWDLARAKYEIEGLLPGFVVEYVRAPEGRTSNMLGEDHSDTNSVYEKLNLLHILWNVDSSDSWDRSYTKATLLANTKTQLRTALREEPSGEPSDPSPVPIDPKMPTKDWPLFYPRGPGNDIVALFHDHNSISTGSVSEFVEAIRHVVEEELDMEAVFTSSRDQIRDVFNKRVTWDAFDHPWHNWGESENQYKTENKKRPPGKPRP